MNVSRSGDAVLLELDESEAGLMRGLLTEMRSLMGAEASRSDPVIGRLMPAAYDDPAEQKKYEEILGDSLRTVKLDALRVVDEAIGPDGAVNTSITEEDAPSWLGVLTDMRLAIATRVGVTEEIMAAEIDPSHPDAPALSVIHWLGWLQESMVESIDPIQGE